MTTDGTVCKTGSNAGLPHHWVYEDANGPISRGVCRYCKEETTGKNYLPTEKGEWDWMDEFNLNNPFPPGTAPRVFPN